MEGEPLRILIVNNTDKENPSYHYRNKMVGEALQARYHEIEYGISASEIKLSAFDIFVFNRSYTGSLKKEIVALLDMGKKVVYETDDNYMAIDENIPTYKVRRAAVPSSIELAKNCHAMTVSTPYLHDVYQKITNRPIKVIPNSIDFTKYQLRAKGNKELVIGWQGSHVHIGDLLMMVPAIRNIQKRHRVKFVIFGIDDTPIKDFYEFCKKRMDGRKWSVDMEKLYPILEEMREEGLFHHEPFTQTVDNYQMRLPMLNFDIGICPLDDTEFNRSKSCLKYYEYAATGTVTLASDVIPYNTEMKKSDLVENTVEAWEEKLEKLVTDGSYRESRWKMQYDWVKKKRNINSIVRDWEKFYKSLK